MNKEEYDKLSTYDKIDFDIQMELYMKYNDTIATINEYLGEQYGYNDLKDYEDLEREEEISLYKKALKEKCDVIDKAIEYIEEHKMYNYDDICISNDIDAEELLEILKGDSNE